MNMNKKYFLLVLLSVFLVLTLNLVIAVEEDSDYYGKLQVSSGQGKIIISGPGGMPAHYCGNNVYEAYINEQCDGPDLGSQTCESKGYASGSLSCKSGCILDTSQCVPVSNPPTDGGNTGSGSSEGSSHGGSSSSGTTTSASSSSSSNCVENWECTNWTNDNLCGTRTCTDKNNCGTTSIKPVEESDCEVFEAQGYEFEKSFLSRITGAVTGTLGTAGTAGVIVFIFAIAGISTYVYKKRKK